MPDYQLAKIYKLICSETNNVYFGSSCQPYLSRRLAQHKSPSNSCVSRHFINPTIHLIELFPCTCIEELRKKERFYIDNYPCVNKQLPGQTPKEYYLANQEQKKEYKKKYYEANQEQILEKIKIKIKCNCGALTSCDHIARHKKTAKHIKYVHTQEAQN